MIKAVVIDANAISRSLLSTVLQNGGFDVVAETNLTSAGLATAARLTPQIVCMDLGGTDGEALERLDQVRASLPKALVFLVSGSFDAPTVEAAIGRGVHGFIVKPFKADTVLLTIRRAIIKLAREHAKAAGAEQA